MSAHRVVTRTDFAPPTVLTAWRTRSLGAGILFLIVGLILFFVSPKQALHSYLVGYLMVLGLSLGSMAWLMVWHLTGGSWGVPIRRILEAAVACLPLSIVGWIPIAIGMKWMYPWFNPEILRKAAEQNQHAGMGYMGASGFVLRAIAYFVIWSLFAWLLLHWSHLQDEPGHPPFGPRFRAVSGIGMLIYAWTLTFAIVDWVMSLTPFWISTIYGFIFMVDQAMIAMCLVAIVAHWMRSFEPMGTLLRAHNFHDYGKLMFTTVMLWAYFNFSQWLIYWSGNLPEETHWFELRTHGDWGIVAFIIIIGQFALPFAILLSRPVKRNSGKLIWVAMWLVLMRFVDNWWNVAPSFTQSASGVWLDAVMTIGLMGLWGAYFFWNLARRPMVVLNDPHLPVFLESAQ